MTAPTPYDPLAIRPARAADLRHLAAVEDSGGALYEAFLGPGHDVEALRTPAASGAQRDAAPGFLLVAGDPVVGFAHVLVIHDEAHLEQVSVRPDHGRRGIGAALVRAAMRRARHEGHVRMSLCTYRDVPWNAPFYAGLGFTVVDPADLLPFQRRLREAERDLGLDLGGPRVVMSIPL